MPKRKAQAGAEAYFVAMELSDLDAVMDIEQRVYTHPWSRAASSRQISGPPRI